MPVTNPLLVILFIPLFESVVYPLFKKCENNFLIVLLLFTKHLYYNINFYNIVKLYCIIVNFMKHNQTQEVSIFLPNFCNQAALQPM